MEKLNIEKLVKLSLFNNTDKERLIKELKKIKFEILRYEKNEHIAFRGDEIKGLYLNLTGSIVAEMLKENGEIKKIEEITSFQPLASAFIFGKFNQFPVDLIAKTEVEILFLEKKELIKLLKNDEILLENFLSEISEKAQFLSKNLWESVSNKTITQKLIEYILKNEKEGIFELKISIKELAEYFNVSRPSLSRVIKTLIEAEILEKIEKGKYRIDKRQLNKLQ